MSEAKKFDAEKLQWDALPWNAVEEATKVMNFGIQKYDKHNYLKGNGLEDWRYFNAMMRHVRAHQKGEMIDPESGLPHLSHAACCLLMWQETIMKNEKEAYKWAK